MELQATSIESQYNYSVKELAYLWNVSRETIRRLFEEEDGVLKFQNLQPRRPRTRTYVTLRIPGWVALRVQKRLSVGVPE